LSETYLMNEKYTVRRLTYFLSFESPLSNSFLSEVSVFTLMLSIY